MVYPDVFDQFVFKKKKKKHLGKVIYFALTSIMKLPFTLSTHAVEKHLDVYDFSISVFFNERVMYRAISRYEIRGLGQYQIWYTGSRPKPNILNLLTL